VTPKNPVGKLTETAISTLKNPIGAAGKVVGQAKGTVALGKAVAETAGSVVGRAAGRRPKQEPRQAPATSPADLRPVPDVNEPAGTRAPGTQQRAVRGAEDSPKKHGDPLAYKREADPGKPAAKKTAAKPAAKATAKKKAPATKAPATKPAAKKAPTKKVRATPADVAEVVEAAVAEDPSKTAAKPARKASAKKAPATKAPAKKATPGGKLPAKKSQPKSAAEVLADEDTDVRTPSGIPAADAATNPDTTEAELTQPGTEPLVDPGTAKAARSESDTLRKAAEQNPE
jgi:hypothetical protein